MAADLNVVRSIGARDDCPTLSRRGITHDQQLGWQTHAEVAMNPTDEFFRYNRCRRLLAVYLLLNFDVRAGFELQIAFFRCVVVGARESSLDIDGMGVMSLDQVRVVAIHGPHQLTQLGYELGRLRSLESRGLYGQGHCEVGKLRCPGPREDRFKGAKLDQDCRFLCRYYC